MISGIDGEAIFCLNCLFFWGNHCRISCHLKYLNMTFDEGVARRLEDGAVGPDSPMYEPRLSSGLSVKYALFPDPNAPIMSGEANYAAGRLYAWLRQNERDLLMRCDGVSLEEARRILVEGGIRGITLVTKAVEIKEGGRYRINPAVTGITPLSSSITISGHGGSQRLTQGICYPVCSNAGDPLYFDLPPGATFKANVGLSDASASPFVKIDPATGEPAVESGGDSAGAVQQGVRVRVRVCGDIRDV